MDTREEVEYQRLSSAYHRCLDVAAQDRIMHEAEIKNYKHDIKDREQLRKETMRMLNIKEAEIKKLRDEIEHLKICLNESTKQF